MLTRRALNRALLARQLLLERSPMGVVDAVEHLVGMQAQAPNPPYLGLWTRLERFAHSDLSDLITSRSVVRLALMRSTLHLVSAEDALGIRPLVQPVQERALRAAWGERLAGADVAAVAAAGRRLVEEQPRTLAELGTELAAAWPDADPAALSAAVRAGVPLVQVPPRGIWGAVGQPAHTSAEQWLGRGMSAMSVDDLVLRYLRAFGPATVRDAQAWSGLTRLREVTDRLGDRLVRLRGEDGAELFDVPGAPLPDPETPAPVRFVADFDNILLSHADRARIMTEEHRREIFTVNGIIPGTVLVDGFVRGTWKITRHRGAATLVVRPLFQIPTRDVQALTVEGERLLAFAAADASRHDVRFNSR